MILPSSIFDIVEEADDYYFPPLTGTYLRVSRMVISFLTLFLTPVWLLFMQNPDWIPSWLEFIRLSDEIHVALIFSCSFWNLPLTDCGWLQSTRPAC